jgi:WD40 repeat protein
MGCSVSQSASKSGGDISQKHSHPDGVLHFSGIAETPSGQVGAGFSILPEGKIIRTLKPDLLPASLQKHAAMIKPAWSVHSGKMVFSAITDSNLSVIGTMDSDGGNFSVIYTAEPDKNIISPCWSASGREIFFLLSYAAESGLERVTFCKMTANGSDFSKIADLSFPGSPRMLRLSSDGKHGACVYSVPPEGGVDGDKPAEEYPLHIIDPLTGKEEKKLSGFDAAWSPDSKKIAVIQDKSTTIQILTISTGEIASFSTGTRFPQKIAWKPDGSKLAYISQRETEHEALYPLQILTIENGAIFAVPIKIKMYTSDLFWTL